MALIEFWIQLENHVWDICPSGKDRMTGLTVEQVSSQGKPPVTLSLKSPVTGHTRTQKMFTPVRDSDGNVADALILRRYTANWAAPADRKVNPWDINEKDPTDNGTMGTIPGPVIECSVGDSVKVHFKNMDMRKESIFKVATKAVTAKGMSAQMLAGGITNEMTTGAMTQMDAPGMELASKFTIRDQSLLEIIGSAVNFPLFQLLPTLQRTHSLHTHGFVFAPQFDGAYPLTPIDPGQPVGSESGVWDGDFKQGDRVPPGGTFTYEWNTLGWPTTQGVWLYHDHSVCDSENVALGAIGIVVIHPAAGDSVADQDVDIRLPQAQQDATNALLDPAFLPSGSPIGNPISNRCFGLANGATIGVLPHQLAALAPLLSNAEMTPMHMGREADNSESAGPTKAAKHKRGDHAAEEETTRTKDARFLAAGEFTFQLSDDLTAIIQLCVPTFRTPPTKALYLQLYHEFANIGMSVNGRKYLGNTPTVIAGPTTKMKFGVVGMGSMAHTFHIHGHRWVIPGPSGTGSAALQQGGSQDTAVSQFEDTRLFGPANSFSFTIDENSGGGLHFMRASPPIGEWHMHCHVLAHMMDGMMGSLLIINGGESAAIPLPSGKPCPTMPINTPPPPSGGGGSTSTTHTVNVQYPNFSAPTSPPVKVGDTVKFHNLDGFEHSVVWDTGGAPANSPPGVLNGGGNWSVVVSSANTFNYHCGIHTEMLGVLTVSA
ncbi:MAG: multicopper oxidase domain-containing protein [Gemmatimonadaceae bacterium]